MATTRLPQAPIRNTPLTERLGFDVWHMYGIDVSPGEAIALAFESMNSPRRQGVFIGTEGLLSIDGVDARAFNLWYDTTPRPVVIRCRESSSGRAVVYNIFEREPGRQISQAHTSGMLVESLPGGGQRYRCCDLAREPSFDRVVFTVRPVA
jgi:hypothetical protein